MFCFPNKPIRIFSTDAILKTIAPEIWVVQPKWNGHRAMAHCDAAGKVVIYSRQGTPLTLAKGNFAWLSMLPLPRPWALDGELLRDGRMIVWDYSTLGGNLEISLKYKERLERLQSLIKKKFEKNEFSFELIETMNIEKYKTFLLRKADPSLEGIVFKNLLGKDFFGPFRTKEISSQFKYRF